MSEQLVNSLVQRDHTHLHKIGVNVKLLLFFFSWIIENIKEALLFEITHYATLFTQVQS